MEYKVHPKEQIYFLLMLSLNLLVYLVLAISVRASFGALLFYGIIFLGFQVVSTLLFIGHLKGNAIRVTSKQFPDVHAILQSYSAQLGLKHVPDMYLIESGGVINALATKVASRTVVVVYSSVFELAYEQGLDAVSFIIGHELGHIKREHIGLWKVLLTFPARFIPFLGSAYARSCELTCDNIGYALCPNGAIPGLMVLTAGKSLYKNVNLEELINNYANDQSSSFATNLAAIFGSHPPLLERIAAVHKQLHRNDIFSMHQALKQSPFVVPNIISNAVSRVDVAIDNDDRWKPRSEGL